ncbi:hypothetical protein ACP4OV_022139 [Aristida adscensionis]
MVPKIMRMSALVEHTIIVLLVWAIPSAALQPHIYNVLDFHAAGDGKTDDAHAFMATWQAACRERSWPIMVIPGGRTFLLSTVRFQGPCMAPITVQLYGKITAPRYIWTTKAANFLTFFSIDNLTLTGNGEIDGQGDIWWNCYWQKRCNTRPILLGFAGCNSLWVQGIQLTDSADKHMTLYRCSQVHVERVSITAPGNSPNTDGITMALSDHVYISACSIQTGDDCVSILTYTTDVSVTNSTCGPGHGISVGSLGGFEEALVERITVSNCSFSGTMAGVRIKTWQGGKGYAKGFHFESLTMTAVQNPIVIDQFYCPQGNCPLKDGGVAISDVRFINIHGTSSEQEAIKLLCSKSVHCRDIYLSDINLSWAKHNVSAYATVLNAYGTTWGTVIPGVKLTTGGTAIPKVQLAPPL